MINTSELVTFLLLTQKTEMMAKLTGISQALSVEKIRFRLRYKMFNVSGVRRGWVTSLQEQ